MRETAKRALMEAAILKELSEANAVTREALGAGMQPGDRITAGDLGAVQLVQPKPRWKVQDWTAYMRWVETHAPEAIVTVTQISPAFTERMLREGEYVSADGEVLTPDGLGGTATTPYLRVSPSDAAHELAHGLLSRLELES